VFVFQKLIKFKAVKLLCFVFLCIHLNIKGKAFCSQLYYPKHMFFSAYDEFEDVELSGESSDSGSASQGSCEEIVLLGLEETYGTKRCPCDCHNTGDDMYSKKKKHCYKCCLAVSLQTVFLCPRHSKNGGGGLSVTPVRASVHYQNMVSAQ